MSDMFVGNKITGNFKPQEALSKNIKDYIVEKYDGVLHLINGNESIALEPLSDNDKLIVNNFSDELGELNESIYQLEENNENVILLLYVYSQVNKLLLETQKIRIHLRREVEKEICSEGCNDIVLDSQADIVPFLRDNLSIIEVYLFT